MDPVTRPSPRHPRPPVSVSPSGWRAYCRACGWESGRYHDRHDATGAHLEHAELEHGVIIPDPQEDQ